MRIVLVIILALLLFLPASAAHSLAPPRLTARSALLLDQATGRILYSKNAHEKLPMASTTKIMTAILALESGRMSETVSVSEHAVSIGGSSVYLEPGEKKTLEELVWGLLLRSGNDAAVAIAEHLSGSTEEFAVEMTRRAAQLGARQTKFSNPHGLHQEEHYTTAYDLALLAAHAMSLPKFREIAAAREKKISWHDRPAGRLLRNQNKLLVMYEGAEGIKTGWTTPAGRCFAGATSRKGWRLVGVVLNAPQMWEDMIKLFDFGYQYYRWQTVIQAGQHLKSAAVVRGVRDRVTLVAGSEAGMPLKEDESAYLRFQFNVREPLKAPLRTGGKAGELQIFFGKTMVRSIPLLAGEDVARKGPGHFLRSFLQTFIRFASVPG
ncbi:MAG: D-alanyl-D-alanine carboxypeptidase DacB [Syntrophomonadaceae bacterium]|nr:D-alanyl-D-alanine carboxypeptidase DacB [Bacillota bacterium]